MTWRGGVLHGQQQVLHISSPRHTSERARHPNLHHSQTNTTLQTGEDTPASPCGVDTTRGAAVRPSTGYNPSHDWRKARRQGLLPTVGGILGSHCIYSYRPPQAGLPPDRNVMSRHGLLSSLGAWGLGTNRKAARN